jgi:hypothetical protein
LAGFVGNNFELISTTLSLLLSFSSIYYFFLRIVVYSGFLSLSSTVDILARLKLGTAISGVT